MSSLFEWFRSRNEESVINKTLIHMQKVLECVVEFEKALSFLIEEKNVDLALKVFFRVDELEHQADSIRRNMLNMLTQVELKPKLHENLTHLTKRIDDIANATNAAARILIYMNYSEFQKLNPEIHLKILEMARVTVETVKKTNNLVNMLLSEEEAKIRKSGAEISELEHECDELRFAINRMLVADDNPIKNPFTAIEIHSCISAMEAITDNAEEVADYIVMLILVKSM
jgi:predicted phosphate transport protein (TIGR00153 family)